jgi:glycosyltransferase involved in cell wall biosynthesis
MVVNANKFIGKTAVIVCHDSVFGPPHELRDYLLKNHISELLFIGHQNRYVTDNPIRNSYYDFYRDGIKIKSGGFYIKKLPEFIAYIRDFILTITWSLLFVRPKIDIFIGLGNLNALSGIILKWLGLSKIVVYYVIDYLPIRFKNKLMNSIYHYVDRICAGYASITWNYARQMIVERQNHWRMSFDHQLVVPNGVNVNRRNMKKNIFNHDLVYIGTLFKKQGIDLVIKALPKLRIIFPDIKLIIIGQGTYLSELKELCQRLKVLDRVTFMGFIADPNAADNIIKKCNLGIATYETGHDFVAYTEPGKVKRYLGCGVPVVMTNVSMIAGEILKNRCGFVIENSVTDLTRIIRYYYNHPDLSKVYRENAVKYSRQYIWHKIFDNAFSESEI